MSDVTRAPIDKSRTFRRAFQAIVFRALIDRPTEFPIDVTPWSTRIVRVRLGGEPQGITSYPPPHVWPDVPHETRVGAETTIDTGELSVSISSLGRPRRQGRQSDGRILRRPG